MKSMTTITSNVRTVKFIMSLLLTVSGFCDIIMWEGRFMSDNLMEREMTYISKDQLKMQFGSAFA